MFPLRTPLRFLRNVLAVLACALMLLSGIAQQRAFAARSVAPGGAGLMLCQPNGGTQEHEPAAPVLHDCFECCLSTVPGLLPVAAVLHTVVPSRIVKLSMPAPLPGTATVVAKPYSRGPPEAA